MARQWHETAQLGPRGATRAEIDRRIELAAARQKQLITEAQLESAGLSRRGARKRSAARRLFRLHPRVFALHPPPYGQHQRWLAAVLACGPASALSDLPAAALHGLLEKPPTFAHVSNPTGAGRSLQGIVVHRRKIARCDLTIRHGIPCTSVTRTIVDLAATPGPSMLEDLLLAADSSRLLNRRRLGELLHERRGRAGAARLRSLVTDDPVEARNVNERRLVSICREFGIPAPLVNHRIDVAGRTFYADFCWPDLRLIVEADSWRWHGGRTAAEYDRDRDQLLSIAGWRVVHFTRDQIHRGRRETGRRLLALTKG